MPILDKTSNLYGAFERICPILKQHKMNASADAVAAAIVETVLRDALDKTTGQPTEAIEWLLEPEQKETRKQIADEIKICVTAAKNLQNSYLHPSGLMDKAEGEKSSVDFV